MAGASLSCECGATVVVPALSVLRAQAVTDAASPSAPDTSRGGETKPGILPEVIAPTCICVKTKRGNKLERRAGLMAALTPDALWIQDTWRLRCLPLQDIAIDKAPSAKELALTLLGSEPVGEKLTLKFARSAEVERWHEKILEWQSKYNPDAPPIRRTVPEGVALVRKAPDVARVELGRVSCVHRTPGTADRGAQLRAAIRGADAIVELRRTKCPEMGTGARQVSGTAVRSEDADARKRLRWRWYAEEVSGLAKRMLLVLALEAALLVLATSFLPGKSAMVAATGESLSDSLAAARLGLALFFAWPLLLIVLLWAVRWPELLRAAGIAVVAVTTLRGLTAVLTQLLAVLTVGTDSALAKRMIWMVADPVEWAIMVAGLVLCVRAWRLDAGARQMLPQEEQVTSVPRKLWSRGLLAASAMFALFCVGLAGSARYQESRYLLQAGVDPRREHEAMLAQNEGVGLAEKGDLGAAERSFQRSLQLWEALTTRRSAPTTYRINLAVTLVDLGWIRLRQHRDDEAEPYYSRAVALADQLNGDPELDEHSRQTLSDARKVLAELRDGENSKLLNQKSAEADRKYEEAEVKDAKGDPEAERLYGEAIALWEEILPHATAEDYRKSAVAQLSVVCLRLGELQKQSGNRAGQEASLKKAIDYAERAVALDPSRPLLKHNLGVARRSLERLRDQAFQDEINKLSRAGRYVDAVDFFTRGIAELDARVHSGKDLELAVPSLAYRLDRFAWFLAHCPDKNTRDTKASVVHARRAAELRSDAADYWYTLAMVQYRNGDWRDSLASLDKMKVIQGDFDACDWLLSTMGLYRLNRQEEARAAFRKAGDWIDERTRKAGDDARLRMEYEFMRPAIEGLLWEARQLLGADVKVGSLILNEGAMRHDKMAPGRFAGGGSPAGGIRIWRRYRA